MIKIERLSDVNSLSSIDPLMRGYLLNQIAFFCKNYDCTEISEFGAFYIIESQEELLNHEALGLSNPLHKTIHEFVDWVSITYSDYSEGTSFINVLYLLNNDYGINIIIPEELLTKELRNTYNEEYTREVFKVDVSKQQIYN